MKVAILKENVTQDSSKPRMLGHIPYPNSDKTHQSNTFYDTKAVSPTLDTCEGGNRQVKILVEQTELPLALDEQNGYIRKDGTVGTIMTDGSSPKHNNRVLEPIGTNVGSIEKTKELIAEVESGKYPGDKVFGKYLFQSSRFNDKPLENISQTIKASKVDCGVITNYRIRKLTPRECWRLQGFDDSDFDKAEKVCSNTQLYKQAGNSIVVNVLEGILGNLLPKPSRSQWLDELLGGDSI